MLKRTLEPVLLEIAKQYPIIVVTGPRQSGKTTLVRKLFAHKTYLSLEDPDHRDFASTDPRGFLDGLPDGAILDEVQQVPALFSYLQTLTDQRKRVGDFILTGSQNFLLMERVTQSLAGRAAITHLLPLSLHEAQSSSLAPSNLNALLIRGLYPSGYNQVLDANTWCKNYINTYVERDVRLIKNILDLPKFRLFLRLLAGRIGQLLNIASLSGECGIDQKTAKAWVGLLETSFMVFLLQPHHKNFNKRLVKQPKLYFCDTGLASYLLGIENEKQMSTHYSRGALFENFVILELIKKRFNQGKEHNLFFWRDHHGTEIDVLLDQGDRLIPIEIKSGKTISQDFFKSLELFKELSGESSSYLIYGGDLSQNRTQAKVISYKEVDTLDEGLFFST